MDVAHIFLVPVFVAPASLLWSGWGKMVSMSDDALETIKKSEVIEMVSS